MIRLGSGLVIGVATAAVLAGCASRPFALLQPQGDTGVTLAPAVRFSAQIDRRPSWMDVKLPKKALLYVSESDNDVVAYEYPSLDLAGTLTGLSGPGASCVDAKGDVYITESSGEVVEYAHGRTKVIRTYTPGGEPLGCSVDAKGDLAVSSYSPGEVVVYTGGDPSKGEPYTDASCAYEWPMGYDPKGNLIGEGEYDKSIAVCALLAGAQSETTLATSGVTIDFPGGTVWDGKYVALGDQEADGRLQTGMYQVRLRGTTLTELGETVLSDTCFGSDADVDPPFVVGKKNTPENHEQGAVVAGVNVYCADAGLYRVGFWHYPQGGDPFENLTVASAPTGVSVSFGR